MPYAERKSAIKVIQMPRDLPVAIDNFLIDASLLAAVDSLPKTDLFPDPRFVDVWVSLGPTNTKDQISRILSLPCVSTIRMNSQKFPKVEDLAEKVAMVKSIKAETKVCVDLSGPKVRTCGILRLYRKESILLRKGDQVVFHDSEVHGLEIEDTALEIPYDNTHCLCVDPKIGGVVLVSDGWQQFRIDDVKGGIISCTALHDCEIYDGRGISVTGMYDNASPITPGVRRIIAKLAQIADSIDYLGLSFVNSRKDVVSFREIIDAAGIRSKTISKIETYTGVVGSREIAEVSDAVMLGRGDLAVELAHLDMDVLRAEDTVRKACFNLNKPCVVATRVSDYVAEGGGDLAVYEKARLLHELRLLNSPLVVMLANETSNHPSAVENTTKILEFIASIQPKIVE